MATPKNFSSKTLIVFLLSHVSVPLCNYNKSVEVKGHMHIKLMSEWALNGEHSTGFFFQNSLRL